MLRHDLLKDWTTIGCEVEPFSGTMWNLALELYRAMFCLKVKTQSRIRLKNNLNFKNAEIRTNSSWNINKILKYNKKP